jgi:long-chain acyl-CoA synthetase
LSGKCGSAGKPLRDIDVEIRNTSELVGDIFVKTPCLMMGYYKNEALTQETIKDGWLDTGDIGFVDQDGYLYITGRKRNIIISGGINIYPEEIEAVLETHPSVKKAIVYGETNHLLGEIPCAKIEADSTIHDVDELKNYCKLYLSEYKVPYKITLTEKIDTTLNGKTKRLR